MILGQFIIHDHTKKKNARSLKHESEKKRNGKKRMVRNECELSNVLKSEVFETCY